jgi:hypothetical protein
VVLGRTINYKDITKFDLIVGTIQFKEGNKSESLELDKLHLSEAANSKINEILSAKCKNIVK